MRRPSVSLPPLLDPVSLLEGTLFQRTLTSRTGDKLSLCILTKKEDGAAGEVAQWLGALPEDQSSVPRTHIRWLTTTDLQLPDL